MPIIKTKDLTDAALDWAVAKCEGEYEWNLEPVRFIYLRKDGLSHSGIFCYSTDWGHGGPIVSREHINLRQTFTEGGYRTSQSMDAVNAKIDLPNGATVFDPLKVVQEYGPTDLIAAMRCYVASKVGDEIEIPFDLVNL